MADAPWNVPAATATRMYPAWPMLEYASMRLRFFCARPIALPTIIVAIASPLNAGCHVLKLKVNASSHTRMNAANAAAFTVAAMYAVIADGAPSYTSGAHMWNGTVATLKPNPTIRNAMPASISGPVLVIDAPNRV